MERAIKMPDIGEGIAEVELVAWYVKPGDTIAEDQPIADVMTDKATVEIPSPVTGRVTWVGGEAGTTFAVGAEIVKIETDGAGAARESKPPPLPPATVRVTSPPKEPAAPSTVAPPVPANGAVSGERPIASPSVRRRAWELGIDLAQVRASGTAGRILQADLDAHAKAHPTQARSPTA